MHLVKLSRDQEKFLLGLLESTAVQKFEENRKAELTFADACRFWGITENMKGDALDDAHGAVHDSLTDLDRLFADADAELSNGRVITAGDIRVADEHPPLHGGPLRPASQLAPQPGEAALT